MPVYVTLWKYTRDGLMDIRNTASGALRRSKRLLNLMEES